MTNDRSTFSSYQELSAKQAVKLGDGRTVDAIGQGQVKVNMNSPNIITNLCSVL